MNDAEACEVFVDPLRMSGESGFFAERQRPRQIDPQFLDAWPEAQRRIQALLERGLQRDANFEKQWPAALVTLLEG
jgi:hypothetical protein